jgi:hypothetical protein
VNRFEVAEYVAQSFAAGIQSLRRIPRVVWVLDDMILPNLFENFVRKQFDFTDDKDNDLASQSRQAVIPQAEIRRGNRDEDAEGRGQADHARPSIASMRRRRVSASKPGAMAMRRRVSRIRTKGSAAGEDSWRQGMGSA